MAGQQRARLATGEAADIVHAPVVRRQQPAIGRQIEQRDRARFEAAVRLFQRHAQARPRHGTARRARRRRRACRQPERHFVDRTRTPPAGRPLSRRGPPQGRRIRGPAWRGRPPPGRISASMPPVPQPASSTGPAADEPASARTRSCAARARRPRYHHMRSSTACMRSYSVRSTPACPRQCLLTARL